MWRELVLRTGATAEVLDPAQPSAIDAIEERLGQSVPDALRALLLEANGIVDEYGTDVIWSAERIAEENQVFRSSSAYADLYIPFSSLMFFGDNGGGDQFGFVRSPDRSDVFVWDHETDDRRLVANSLEQYLVACLESDGEDWHRQ